MWEPTTTRRSTPPTTAPAMYGEMAAVGLRQTVIGVRFKPSEALVIQDKRLLDRIDPERTRRGVARRPRRVPVSAAGDRGGSREPGALRLVRLRGRPGVSRGAGSSSSATSPTSPRSGDRSSRAPARTPPGRRSGGTSQPRTTSLKGIDPAIEVVGIGLSPRGNDKPKAKSNVSTSPVRFVRALGAWYRASGRTRPLMDAFSFHPYPNKATDPLDRGYGMAERRLRESRPRQAGAVGRVRRHRAADDAERPAAPPRRGRMAGRHVAIHGLPGARERPGHGRADPGGDLRRPHPPLRL